MKSKRLFLVICLLSLFTALYAQTNGSVTGEAPADNDINIEAADNLADNFEADSAQGSTVDGNGAEQVTEEEVIRLIITEGERQRISMELKTSTLPELAVWSRTLGLSESGTRADIVKRIMDYYSIREPAAQTDDKQKIITIESAEATEYFTIEVIDEDYARLRGEVILSLKDEDAVHWISAEDILFNRTRNILTASGKVIYQKTEGDTIETFRGENITVNIDNWSSIFLDGSSERKLESDGTAYLFSGTVISRTNEDAMILNNAKITTAGNEEALWSINATKLWLLPGSDFAIFNAVLNVGEIPVLYIPFFYYPADEVIFHPVIGFRSREGGFVQTTTYILGRPKANTAEASSISKILGNTNDNEKERQGIFLRNTGKKITDPNALSLRALIDYYVNLGAFMGVELNTPQTGILNQMELAIGLGFTRTVSMEGGDFTPYAPNYDGSFDEHTSNIFSQSVPFRYRIRFKSGVNFKYGNLNWDLPYHSDPLVDRDFMNRSESMDWMNMIQQGAAMQEDSAEGEISPYTWLLEGSLRPSLPFLSPYVSSFSIQKITMSLGFKRIIDKEIAGEGPPISLYSPMANFFAPDKFIMYNIVSSLSGTPLSIGGQTQNAASVKAPEIEDPLKGIGTPISPWAEEEEKQAPASSGDILTPPVLTQRFDLPRAGNVKFDVDYQLNPSSTAELQFMNENWETFDDVEWSEKRTILTSFTGAGSLNFRFNHSQNLFTNVVNFNPRATFREYTYMNDELDETVQETLKRQQYAQTNYNTGYTYTGSLRPFYRNPVFGATNLGYNFGGTLVRSKRYEGGDEPELTPQWGAWVKEERKDGEDILGLTAHKLSTNLAANIMDQQQNINVSMDLPPFDTLISTSATFRAWITTTEGRFQMRKPEEEDEWKFDPFHFTETLKLGNAGSFTYYMILKPEEDNEITTITCRLSLWRLRASYEAEKQQKAEFNHDELKWVRYGDPELIPKLLLVSYNHDFGNIQVIKNRLGFSVRFDTSLRYDLIQYTNSNFSFGLGFTLNVNNFLELKFTMSSINNVIWRYFKDVPGMEDLTSMYMEGEQNNLFIDLFDSFNFFDDTKRRRSGFKMGTVNSISATHHLGDWTADLVVTMYPYLNNDVSPAKYEVTSDISFLVQWKPITEIKSKIDYEGKTEKWFVE
ncbi:MAG: LPS-assembly protein LptD [Treponema sp.]|jgi:hypothetical protein|nr:LPS-assembly protein LptD [Treponema sp.]